MLSPVSHVTCHISCHVGPSPAEARVNRHVSRVTHRMSSHVSPSPGGRCGAERRARSLTLQRRTRCRVTSAGCHDSSPPVRQQTRHTSHVTHRTAQTQSAQRAAHQCYEHTRRNTPIGLCYKRTCRIVVTNIPVGLWLQTYP